MRLKLFLLSPVTSLYNYQLNIGTLSMKKETDRVLKIQLCLIPIGFILGAPMTALLSIGNLLYILLLMYNYGEIKEEPMDKMKQYFLKWVEPKKTGHQKKVKGHNKDVRE